MEGNTMTENTKLWDAVERTPHDQTKEITGKPYKGNSPKPYYLVRRATETFGPCGIGWGFEIVAEKLLDGAMLEPGFYERIHMAHVRVWYEWGGKRGTVEHVGQTVFSGRRKGSQDKPGLPFTDEDAPKKSVTDALTKALSMLGFAGDIFMGRYDDSKYVADLKQEQADAAAPKPAAKPAPNAAFKVAKPKDPTDFVNRLGALIAGAPDAATLMEIQAANQPALDRLKAGHETHWNNAMAMFRDHASDVLNQQENER